jgi:hypothetical protein
MSKDRMIRFTDAMDYNRFIESGSFPLWDKLEPVPPEPLTLAWHLLHERIEELEEQVKREHERAEFNAQCAGKNAERKLETAGRKFRGGILLDILPTKKKTKQ